MQVPGWCKWSRISISTSQLMQAWGLKLHQQKAYIKDKARDPENEDAPKARSLVIGKNKGS